MKYTVRKHGGARLILAKPQGLPGHMRGPIVEIRGLRTELAKRGRGDAAALMRKITAEADMAGAMLFLHVAPDTGTDRDRLAAFYGRNGFVAVQAEPLLLIRPHAGMSGATAALSVEGA